MRQGCSGCLVSVVLLGLTTLLVGGLIGVGARILAASGDSDPVTSPGDGTRAQQKLFDLARQTRRGHTVTLSEAEVNGLLAHHLVEAGGVRLAGLSVRLIGNDRLQLRARSPLVQVLDEVALGAVADALPETWRARPVQFRVGGRLRVEGGPPRQARVEIDEFTVGRQRLPAPVLRLLVDPAAVGLLRWRLPDHVERVEIEPGRVVIRAASSH